MQTADWHNCKNILVMRPDNMGDLVMSGPAIRALKESFSVKITLLTSSMAANIAAFMPEIDEVMVFDLPWVKLKETSREQIPEIVEQIKQRDFDSAVIFTVYSQNPLPTAMLAYMAGIPKVLAYCRENPYGLLTDWIPDKEPYQSIKHQVTRDLDLVKSIGAVLYAEHLHLTVNEKLWPAVEQKLALAGVDLNKPWLLLHPGVSEEKRQFPVKNWIDAGKKLIDKLNYQLVLTGMASEQDLISEIIQGIYEESFSLAGQFNLAELICLVKHAPVLLSVNTGTGHIAAAVNTPVVVLYAQTNPQHTPWKVPCRVLPFAVKAELKSKNEVIAFVDEKLYSEPVEMPDATDIFNAVKALLSPNGLSSPPFHGIPNESRAIPAS